MAAVDMEIEGGVGMTPPVLGDVNIVDDYGGRNRREIIHGCRYHEIWWGSQAVEYLAGSRQSAEAGATMGRADAVAHAEWIHHIRSRFGEVRRTNRATVDNRPLTTEATPVISAEREELFDEDLIGSVEWDLEAVGAVTSEQIYIATDGSTDYFADRVAMGLMVYTKHGGGTRPRVLARGAGTYGVDREDASSFRAELHGLVAGMALTLGRQRGGLKDRQVWELVGRGGRRKVIHHLDNQGVVNVAMRVHETTYNELLNLVDADLWYLVRGMKEDLAAIGVEYRVEWHRGHPEKHKPDRLTWTTADWAEFEVDELAKRAFFGGRAGGATPRMVRRMEWGLAVEGKPCTGDVRRAVHSHLETRQLKRYLVEDKGWTEDRVSGLEWGVIHKVLSAIRQPARRVQTLKYMTGWLATMKVLHDRGKVPSDTCGLCSTKAVETGEHVTCDCTRPWSKQGWIW